MSLLRSRPSQQRDALTPAERVRSILATTSDLRVGVLNLADDVPRHAMTPGGSLLFLPAPDSPERIFCVAPNLPAQSVQATATDLAPVASPDRVRGQVHMTGKLGLFDRPLPAGALDLLTPPGAEPTTEPVLQFVPQRISLTWACEDLGDTRAVDVPVDDYRNSRPDPLAELEGDWLSHMHVGHPQALRALAQATTPGLDTRALRPLALDRHGIVLRLGAGSEAQDVRINFATPIRCGCEVREAFAELLVRSGAEGVC